MLLRDYTWCIIGRTHYSLDWEARMRAHGLAIPRHRLHNRRCHDLVLLVVRIGDAVDHFVEQKSLFSHAGVLVEVPVDGLLDCCLALVG